MRIRSKCCFLTGSWLELDFAQLASRTALSVNVGTALARPCVRFEEPLDPPPQPKLVNEVDVEAVAEMFFHSGM